MGGSREWPINPYDMILNHINTNFLVKTRTIVLVGIPLTSWIGSKLQFFEMKTINKDKKQL